VGFDPGGGGILAEENDLWLTYEGGRSSRNLGLSHWFDTGTAGSRSGENRERRLGGQKEGHLQKKSVEVNNGIAVAWRKKDKTLKNEDPLLLKSGVMIKNHPSEVLPGETTHGSNS